jgi:hypothetical protein
MIMTMMIITGNPCLTMGGSDKPNTCPFHNIFRKSKVEKNEGNMPNINANISTYF